MGFKDINLSRNEIVREKHEVGRRRKNCHFESSALDCFNCFKFTEQTVSL